MRLPAKKTVLLFVILIVAYFLGHAIFRVYQASQNQINQSRTLLVKQGVLSKEQKILTPHPKEDLRILQGTADTRDLINFQGSYFAATSGGLLKISLEGEEIQHFSVLDGLPESDLLSLGEFENKLYIGTQTQGIVTFDGEKFTQILFPKHKLNAVTKFLNDNGRLLIATFSGGLLEFDGKDFREIKENGNSIPQITTLHKTTASLLIGTFSDGLYLYENDSRKHFTTADGLPSNRIVGVVENLATIYVATDFGIAILENNSFRNLKTTPMVSSIQEFGGKIFVSRENGEILECEKDCSEVRKLESVAKTRLTVLDNQLFELTNRGIFKNSKQFSHNKITLTDNFVSAITVDALGNIWAGTFRNGIDVFSSGLKNIKHLESDNIQEINSLQTSDGDILVATSRGLWKFDGKFAADLLETGSITHFSGDAIATNRGLKLGEKLLTNVNGLPSNSTYTTLRIGDSLYVGTLGGLAVIEANKVVRTYTDGNSTLTNNWITSLCSVNNRIFIGTYGGGILELLQNGKLLDFSAEIGKFVVNPNAIYSDGERLYVGTLEGVRVLDLKENRWSNLSDVLPSQAVFGITANAENVYFATTSGILEVNNKYFSEVMEK
jgi:ligand-binding sensor domain-containing protein